MADTLTTVLFWPQGNCSKDSCWQPAVDVFRTRFGWLLKYDLAGVRLEDVDVWVSGRKITVAGVRRDLTTEDGYTFHKLEISYNRFERTIELPSELDRENVRVEGRDGILLVRVNTEEKENE